MGDGGNIYSRKNFHFSQLKYNRHPHKYLQNSWDKYGEENFEFKILLTCHPEMLIWYEQQFLDQWKPEYNLLQQAGSPKGYKHTLEAKDTIRNRFKGVSKSKEHIEKVRLANIGRIPSRITIDLSIEKNSKVYKGLISPNGIVYSNIKNLNKFQNIIKINQLECNDSVILNNRQIEIGAEDLDLVTRARSRAFALLEDDPGLASHPELLDELRRRFKRSIDWLFRS